MTKDEANAIVDGIMSRVGDMRGPERINLPPEVSPTPTSYIRMDLVVRFLDACENCRIIAGGSYLAPADAPIWKECDDAEAALREVCK